MIDYEQGPPPAAPVLTLNLADEAALVRDEQARREIGHSAVVLAKHDDLRVVLLTLDAGAIVKKHRVEASATLHPVEGRVRVHLPDGAIELGVGQLLVLARDVPHDVEALEKSAVLLSLGHASAAEKYREEP